MQLPGQSTAVSVAIVRRTHRRLPILCLPILIVLVVAVVGHIYLRITNRFRERRVGAMSERQVIERAEALCSRLAGAQATVLSTRGSAAGIQPAREGHIPHGAEWYVQCLAAGRRYSLEIDAGTRELLAVMQEHEPPVPIDRLTPSGDLRGALSEREAQLCARRYLRLAGLPLPAHAMLSREGKCDFTFEYPPVNGIARRLRVSINPKNETLELLVNARYRASASPSSATHVTAPRYPVVSPAH